MTRETKVGLIVAGSFLCLVAIVVASKWRHGDDPSQEPEPLLARRRRAQAQCRSPAAETSAARSQRGSPPREGVQQR